MSVSGTTTLFECMRLVHDAPPIWTSPIIRASAIGKRVSAGLIAAMTGGTERAKRITRSWRRLPKSEATRQLGSQRAMYKDLAAIESYGARPGADHARAGNIGVVQAGRMKSEEIAELAGAVARTRCACT
jgi:isopentenyl diphosphate isomerase/L-lactate dehydrogenase-like FMN-dependent dehydrogenase